MAKHAQLELDNQLCFPLYAASRAMTKAYQPLLEPFDLTYPQYLTMLAVWASPDAQTVGELGERLRLDSGTLTPLLKRLETRGLVERHRDPADERRVLVSATADGDVLQDRLADVPMSLAVRTGLSVEDGIEFRRLLDRLLSALDEADAAEATDATEVGR